jgi:hypothetical protein
MQKKINYFPERAERPDSIMGGRCWYESGLFPRTGRGAMRACAEFRTEEHGTRRSVFLASQGLFLNLSGTRRTANGGIGGGREKLVRNYDPENQT